MAVARWRLAGAGSADQDDVVRLLGEGHVGQLHHQLAVHRRDLEVEAGQIAVHRELRCVHLVAHRAHRPVGRLGLQQMLEQPARALQRRRRAPGSTRSAQAPAMPCRRSCLSSTVETHAWSISCASSVAGGTQPVVARGVGQRRRQRLQRRGSRSGRRGVAFSRASTLSTCSTLTRPDGGAALQRQLHRHQHRVQPGAGHDRQHLRHHAVAAGLAQQRSAQLLQRLGQVGERRPVAQRAGLALQQRDVVLPVVAGLAFVAQRARDRRRSRRRPPPPPASGTAAC